jgi:hypothetical protein
LKLSFNALVLVAGALAGVSVMACLAKENDSVGSNTGLDQIEVGPVSRQFFKIGCVDAEPIPTSPEGQLVKSCAAIGKAAAHGFKDGPV